MMGVTGGTPMATDPKEELTEGLKHCLWFRSSVLMDHLMTLRSEVNQFNETSSAVSNKDLDLSWDQMQQ